MNVLRPHLDAQDPKTWRTLKLLEAPWGFLGPPGTFLWLLYEVWAEPHARAFIHDSEPSASRLAKQDPTS